MTDFAKERLDGSLAFEVTGIEFCGPFLYKSEGQACKILRLCLHLFHLELIKDLFAVGTQLPSQVCLPLV